MLDEEQWQRKEELIANTELSILQEPVGEHLDWLEQPFERRLLAINRRIASGENRKRSGRWTLHTPRARTAVNHPLFEVLPDVNIQTVLRFVNRRTHFMDAFHHVSHRFTKSEADKDLYDKVRTPLYGFKHPSRYEGPALKPLRKIQRRLIEFGGALRF